MVSWPIVKPAAAAPKVNDDIKEKIVKRTPKFALLCSAIVAGALIIAPTAAADTGNGNGPNNNNNADGADTVLQGYATDTWASLAAMTNKKTGLPADNVEGDLSSPSDNTSPTNIGGYLWSTISARELGIISKAEAFTRMKTTLKTLGTIERHEPSGMFYNWYSPIDGHKLTTWPDSGDPVDPFLSTSTTAGSPHRSVSSPMQNLGSQRLPMHSTTAWILNISMTSPRALTLASTAAGFGLCRHPDATFPATTAATAPSCTTRAIGMTRR